mgnify:CR=1 FL=1
MAPSLVVDLRTFRYDDDAKVQYSFQAVRKEGTIDVSGDGRRLRRFEMDIEKRQICPTDMLRD